jgi:hypothetical protein
MISRSLQGTCPVALTPLVSLGLGCFYAWFLLTQYLIAGSTTDLLGLFSGRLVFGVAVLALFVFAFFLSRFVYPICKRFQPPLLPLALVGMFLIAYNPMFGNLRILVCLFGVACIGLEYAWLTLIWVELFGLLESPRSLYQLGFSVVTAALIVALGSALPRVALVIFAAMLPLLSTIALALAFRMLEKSDKLFVAKLKRFKKPALGISLSRVREDVCSKAHACEAREAMLQHPSAIGCIAAVCQGCSVDHIPRPLQTAILTFPAAIWTGGSAPVVPLRLDPR